MRSARHQQNIVDKAERGLEAIESLIRWRLINDTDFPNVTNLDEGLKYMLTALQGDDGAQTAAAWWVSIGVEHDRLRGKVQYRPGELPTNFDTSRETLLNLLDATIWAAEQPQPVDPFAGIDAF